MFYWKSRNLISCLNAKDFYDLLVFEAESRIKYNLISKESPCRVHTHIVQFSSFCVLYFLKNIYISFNSVNLFEPFSKH